MIIFLFYLFGQPIFHSSRTETLLLGIINLAVRADFPAGRPAPGCPRHSGKLIAPARHAALRMMWQVQVSSFSFRFLRPAGFFLLFFFPQRRENESANTRFFLFILGLPDRESSKSSPQAGRVAQYGCGWRGRLHPQGDREARKQPAERYHRILLDPRLTHRSGPGSRGTGHWLRLGLPAGHQAPPLPQRHALCRKDQAARFLCLHPAPPSSFLPPPPPSGGRG